MASGRIGRTELHGLHKYINSLFAGTVASVNSLTNLRLESPGDPAIYRGRPIKTRLHNTQAKAVDELEELVASVIEPYVVSKSYIFWKVRPTLISRVDHGIGKKQYYGTCTFIIIWNKAGEK